QGRESARLHADFAGTPRKRLERGRLCHAQSESEPAVQRTEADRFVGFARRLPALRLGARAVSLITHRQASTLSFFAGPCAERWKAEPQPVPYEFIGSGMD